MQLKSEFWASVPFKLKITLSQATSRARKLRELGREKKLLESKQLEALLVFSFSCSNRRTAVPLTSAFNGLEFSKIQQVKGSLDRFKNLIYLSYLK